MKILVTGAAGFIGFHLATRLVEEGNNVVGIDNLNDYYDVSLKHSRLVELGIQKTDLDHLEEGVDGSNRSGSFRFYKMDLADRSRMEKLFDEESFDVVVNLAAQAGVRYSLENPHAYTESNITGFLNILEGCRHSEVSHLVYASSSSVYGANEGMPFKTDDRVDHPVSLYAATKKSNELMAHTYSHLYKIPATGLRFFTVYGPWGRPDMAYYKFAELMRDGKPIDVYNHGKMKRDFTYIDDIIESLVRLIPLAPTTTDRDPVPARLYNIGRGEPVGLMEFIEILEAELGMTAEKRFLDMQPGDVPATWADVEDLYKTIDYRPKVNLEEGIARFARWYREYHL
ncbi:MAG: NAD-dependent epimerase [Bacteroidota bacterium]